MRSQIKFAIASIQFFFVAIAFSAALIRPGYDMDYGPALDYTVEGPSETVTKGVTVKLSSGTNSAAILFDTETFQYAAGWTYGWLDLSTTHLATYKGALPPRIKGSIRFTNPSGPAFAHNGNFTDPRTNGIGVLPREWGRYLGYYRHGNIIFRYMVNGNEVLDMPGLMSFADRQLFTRTLNVANVTEPLFLGFNTPQGRRLTSITNSTVVTLGSAGSRRLPGKDLRAFTKGGPALWPEVLTTKGSLGANDQPFTVDTITVPEKNPWNSWMRLTALDFFSDGRAAVTTWNGDVWIVSGIDESLQNVKWKRFASGLFDPLGLKIVRDQIYVLERHQITLLHDLNNDGEADYFECFNNDCGVSPSYHAFAMDLQTDSHNNFYFTRAGQRVDLIYPLNGGMVKVSADGQSAQLIAHGLRAANGMAIGPNDEIICSDNQGNWTPSSRINYIKPGGFYGYVLHAHTDIAPTNYEPPLCWIPMSMDNSSGGEVFVQSATWPSAMSNHLLHTSYGKAALFDVLWETVDGVAQGGVVKFPLKFASGIQRARFNPKDGQLYVVGLKGWQTEGVRDGCFQRVRCTVGRVVPSAPPSNPSADDSTRSPGAVRTPRPTLNRPIALHIKHDAIEIQFSDPLDKASAEDLQSYALEQWNYRWTDKYGSDDYSTVDPNKKGHDLVALSGIKLDESGTRLTLSVLNLKPVMQMKIKFSLKTKAGEVAEGEIYNTINRVPGVR